MADEQIVLQTKVDEIGDVTKLKKLFDDLGISAVGLTERFEKYNTAGKRTSQTVKILTEDLRQLFVTLGSRGGLKSIKLIDSGEKERREAQETAREIQANIRENERERKRIAKELAAEEQANIRTAKALLRELNKEKLAQERQAARQIASEEQDNIKTAKRLLSDLNKTKLTEEKQTAKDIASEEQDNIKTAKRLLSELNRDKLREEKQTAKDIAAEEQSNIKDAKRLLNELNKNKLQQEKQTAKELAAIEKENIQAAGRLLNDLNKQKLQQEKDVAREINNTYANNLRSSVLKELDERLKSVDAATKTSALGSINSAVSGVRAGNLDPSRFYQIFQAISKNQPFTALTREEERAEVALRRLLATLDKFEANSNKGGQGLLLNLTQVVRILQVQVLHRIFGEIINAMVEGIRTAQEYQKEIAKIQTITQENFVSTQQWSKALTQLSSDFNIELLDATRAAYDLISNQLAKGTEATDTLSHAFKFAQITGTSAKEAVDLLSFSLNAFKLSTADSERVLALWFKTIDLGNITGQQLAQNLGSILPFAKQLGISMEEVGAGIETLTIQGVQADSAMTLLKNIFKEFVKPTKEMKELFIEWGVTSGQAAFQTFGFLGVIQKLNKELISGGVERLGTLTDDLRALSGTLALSGDANIAIFEKGLKAVQGSTEKFRNAYEIIKQSPATQLAREFNELKNSFVGVGDSLVRAFAGLNSSTPGESGLIGITAKTISGIKDFADSAAYSIEFLSDKLKNIPIPSWLKGDDKKKPSGWVEAGSTSYLDNLLNNWNTDESAFSAARIGREAKEMARNEEARGKALDAARAFAQSPEVKRNYDEIASINALLKKRAEKRGEETKERAIGFAKATDKDFAKLSDKEIKNLSKDQIAELIGKFNTDTLDKFKKKFDELVKKSEELKLKIADAFDLRNFEKSLSGLDLFQSIEPTLKYIDKLRNESFEFFNTGNIEEARNKFEQIQKITEKINDGLQKQIEKSIENIKKVDRDSDQRKFDRLLRGAGTSKASSLITDRINLLRDKAFGTSDPDEARKYFDEQEKLAEKLNDIEEKKKKEAGVKNPKNLKGDKLLDQIDEDRKEFERRNIERAKKAALDEGKLAKDRINLEDEYTEKETAKFERAKELLAIEEKSDEIARNKINALVKQREELERMINAYNNAITAGGSVTKDGKAVPLGLGGIGFASGGLLSGPMGRDNLLIRAHAGEFVVNSEATRAFYPQLVAMNSGMEPRGFASGGPVTNVGDINITQHSTGNVQTDVRELGRLIQREVVRGTIRFKK